MTQTDSLYEQFGPLTQVNKLRFVDWFSGDVINAFKWDTFFAGSAGVVSMGDVQNGGLNIASNTSSGTRTGVNWGDGTLLPFDEDACTVIGVCSRNTANTQCFCGLSDSDTLFTGAHTAGYLDDTGFGLRKQIITMDSSTLSGTDTPIDRNLDMTHFKMTCKPTEIDMEINNILYITKTTNIPTALMAPSLAIRNATAGIKNNSYTYYEVFNT